MRITLELPRPVAVALLRYQIETGIASPAGAAAHCIIHFLSQRGYF